MRPVIPVLICLAGLAVAGQAQQAPSPSQPTFQSGVDVVQVDVSVLDKDRRPVRGLRLNDFRLLEDGVEVAIQEFGVEGDNADRALSVAVLLDLSESMRGQVRRVREAHRAPTYNAV